MRLKHLVLGAAAAGLVGASALVSQAAAETFIPLFTYRTGPFANSGIPIANGMHDYLKMLNERDGGIGGVQDRHRGVRDRLQEREGRRVLRKPQEQEAGGDHALFDRHHAGADPEGRRSTTSRCCRWPTACRPRRSARISRGSSIRRRLIGTVCRSLLKYIGGKEGGLDKLKGKTIGYIFFDGGYGREPMPLLHAACQGLRLQRQGISGSAGRHAEPVRHLAQRSPRPSELDDPVGLGRDESDRRAGSRQDRLPDRSLHRHLVVRQRGRRASGRSRRAKATCRSTSTRSVRTSSRSRTSKSS